MKKISILIVVIAVFMTACKKKFVASDGKVDTTIYVKNGSNKMPVNIHGDASNKVAVILIHGGPGGSGLGYRFGKYVEELEKEYIMCYWDQRGQGMSQGHKGDMNIAMMTEDLYQVVQVVKAKLGDDYKIVLFGHSWGGGLGSAYMVNETYQSAVDAWIEADGAHDIPLLNKYAIRLFEDVANEQIAKGNSVESWEEILEWVASIDTNNLTMEDGGAINERGHQIEQTLAYDGEIAVNEDEIDYSTMRGENPITSAVTGIFTSNTILEEVEALSLTNQLYKINKPSLFLYGKYDFVCPPALGIDAYNKVSSTKKEFVLFDHSGHSPMDSEPAAFVGAMKNFIEKL